MKDGNSKSKTRNNSTDLKRLQTKIGDKQIEETVKDVVNEQSGIFQVKDLTAQGIHPEQFQRYLKKSGKIEKVAHGMYVRVDEFTDEFQLLQTRFNKGIFSYETALFLHDLTDVTPFDYHMTFPQGYNNKRLTESGVIPSYAVPERYNLGISKIQSPSGNIIRVYDVEKTFCDIYNPRHKMDKDVQLIALKKYMKRKDKNLSRLMQYAKILKVEKKLRPYLEALL
ncbi:type IV toxin-antitoxin system AbiEi family antitoxin domain-containing protein [Trichococcus alkaliphilus]|uniref:type IV toxin-antitoxin system AbiEi family antitoxin domain-containing protein n=1 Tax=Trichococcus alkaliphilus TaxID=2052943 RepID=UPI000D0BCE41|nr:type IV toxin-antitoxin system AbiEi family antitoxin domain-containing protein [Trichococcus alkaliphilus]